MLARCLIIVFHSWITCNGVPNVTIKPSDYDEAIPTKQQRMYRCTLLGVHSTGTVVVDRYVEGSLPRLDGLIQNTT